MLELKYNQYKFFVLQDFYIVLSDIELIGIMKRCPYKSYFVRGGDGVMPRSTFYEKLAKYRHDVSIQIYF